MLEGVNDEGERDGTRNEEEDRGEQGRAKARETEEDVRETAFERRHWARGSRERVR